MMQCILLFYNLSGSSYALYVFSVELCIVNPVYRVYVLLP